MLTGPDEQKGAQAADPVVEISESLGPESPREAILAPEETAPRRPRKAIHSYLKVVGLCFVYLVTFGQLSAFSTYQDYYEEKMLASYSSSTISWIGTIQVFLLGVVGLLSGALYDRGYAREALIPGFGLVVLGLVLLSFSYQLWHVILSQGFLIGIGGGLATVPAISIVSHGFPQPTLALGVGAAGSAIGGIIWPIVFQRLLPSIGFAWTSRVFALLVLVLSVLSYVMLIAGGGRWAQHGWQRWKHPGFLRVFFRRTKEENGSESDTSAAPTRKHHATWRDAFDGRAYQFLCVGVFFALLGYWVPLFYLVPYASRSLGTSSSSASDLLAILNAASLFGRILPAAVGHKVGPANILLAGATALGALILAWIAVGSIAGLTVWSIFLGFVAGSVITIPNAVASRLSQTSNTGLRIGLMWGVGAIAELVGPPIAGALLTYHNSKVNYLGCQLFGGVSVLVGAGFLVVPAWSIIREDKTKRETVAG
ncbi:major facilitator superfamily domain-containing protein [Xylaria palmicola]|nr:major facilitator superfamily domain-containing protein [Xylaria palmicola]